MKLFFFIFLILISITTHNFKAIDMVNDLSDLMDDIKLILDHPTFRLLDDKSQYKFLKVILVLVDNFSKKSNSIIESQLFSVGSIPACRFC